MRDDRRKWLVISLVFFATLINFLDRLTVSVLAPIIQQSLHLTNLQFAGISTWFLIAYTASQGLSGRLYDRVGTRRGFSISVTVWSLAAMAHSLARDVRGLSVCRFVLGLGEAGNWPGAAKVIAEWFPVEQRALAMGIFNSGAALGSAFVPPVVIWLQAQVGWQMTFLLTGSAGFLWLIAWLILYHDRGPAVTKQSVEKTPWLTLIGQRRTWGIILARLLTDPTWWLYLTWLPLYLYNARGFSLKQIGLFAWFPYVMADAGSLGGGWLSGFLVERGWTVNRARKTVMIIGVVMMSTGIMAARAPDPLVALAWISVVLAGFQAWVNNVQTLPSDIFPESSVGSVAGLGGVGAGAGSICSTLAIGWVVDHFSYTPVLIAAGLLPMAGTALLFLLVGRIPQPEGARASR
ncbi:MAG: MFS transporter [Bryobacteraceae bacterium]